MSVEELREHAERVGGARKIATGLGRSTGAVYSWTRGAINVSPRMAQKIRALPAGPPPRFGAPKNPPIMARERFIEFVRAAGGLRAAGRKLGISHRAVKRYVAGEVNVPQVIVDRIEHPERPREVKPSAARAPSPALLVPRLRGRQSNPCGMTEAELLNHVWRLGGEVPLANAIEISVQQLRKWLKGKPKVHPRIAERIRTTPTPADSPKMTRHQFWQGLYESGGAEALARRLRVPARLIQRSLSGRKVPPKFLVEDLHQLCNRTLE